MGEMASPTTAPETANYYYDADVREQIEDALFQAEAAFGVGGVDNWLAEVGAAFPDDRGYFIPDEGGWVIVKRPPHTIIPAPPIYSIWFAKPVYASRTFKRIVADGRRRNVSWPMLKARILTEDGELDLLPEEFVPCDDIMAFVDMIGEGVELHFLGPEPDEIAERLFYLRAHGLGVKDATSLLLGDMQSNHVYLTVDIGGS